MRALPLTNTTRHVVMIDDEDYPYISSFSWYYAITEDGNRYVLRTDNPRIYLHRVIMKAPKNLYVDHIDGNGLNNTRKNLRLTTNSLNTFNGVVRCTNTSGYPGVSFDKRRQKWYARIRKNCTNHFLGYYQSKEQAIEARKQGELKFYGELSPTFRS